MSCYMYMYDSILNITILAYIWHRICFSFRAEKYSWCLEYPDPRGQTTCARNIECCRLLLSFLISNEAQGNWLKSLHFPYLRLFSFPALLPLGTQASSKIERYSTFCFRYCMYRYCIYRFLLSIYALLYVFDICFPQLHILRIQTCSYSHTSINTRNRTIQRLCNTLWHDICQSYIDIVTVAHSCKQEAQEFSEIGEIGGRKRYLVWPWNWQYLTVQQAVPS